MTDKFEHGVFNLVEGGDKLNLWGSEDKTVEDTDPYLAKIEHLQDLVLKIAHGDYSGYDHPTYQKEEYEKGIGELGFPGSGPDLYQAVESTKFQENFPIISKDPNVDYEAAFAAADEWHAKHQTMVGRGEISHEEFSRLSILPDTPIYPRKWGLYSKEIQEVLGKDEISLENNKVFTSRKKDLLKELESYRSRAYSDSDSEQNQSDRKNRIRIRNLLEYEELEILRKYYSALREREGSK